MSNTSWLIADKVLRMAMGLIVGVWIARYLGPQQFGLLNYGMAFVALFMSIATLGLGGIVVRDLVNNPETSDVTLGSALLLRVVSGLLAFVIAVSVIGFVRPDDDLAKMMVTVLGAAMVFKASEIIKYWFDAHLESKYSVWIENGIFLLFSFIKIALIITHATLMAFIWVMFFEGVLVAISLTVAYGLRRGSIWKNWRVQYRRAKILLNDSWPLMLSSLAIIVYMRIDQIMIGQMLGDEAVGIYSAAVRISEIWYFIPTVIVSSVFPTLLEAKNRGENIYSERFQQLFDMTIAIAWLFAIPVSLCANEIVNLLYGDKYLQAAPALSLYVWTGVFFACGTVSGRWLIAEGYGWIALRRNLIGAIINVGLNFYLIPLYGVAGAAASTLIAICFAFYFASYISPVTRHLFFQETRSIFLMNIPVYLKKLKRTNSV